MKKAKCLSLLLIFAMAIGGCSKTNTSETAETTAAPETTITETTEEPTETTETTETTTTEEPAPTFAPEITQYSDVKVNDYITVSRDEYKFIPQFTLEGDDFKKANEEIMELAGDTYVVSMDYAFIKADSRRNTLLVYVGGEWEWLDVLCYTFDTQTNEILDNDTILAIAGEPLSEFYEDASDSLEAILEERNFRFDQEDYEYTLSSENINKNMMMFLGKNDELFLVSDVCSGGGADFYIEIWDLNAKCWSGGCQVDAAGLGDEYSIHILKKGTDHDQISLFAKTNEEDKQIEFYDYRDGGLVLFGTISTEGKKYASSRSNIYLVEGEARNDLEIDQDGNVSLSN
ncbi:MAG: hypothetical protein K6F83_01605 [Clostridiales bacterium]|nr:hypothetical protein [Clostridiales bacterium]